MSGSNGPRIVLPTFIIIGAQKSATRWLRINLDAHPDIFTVEGEPSFFNSRRFCLEASKYAERFEEAADIGIRGEATPGYMMWRADRYLVPCRIRGTLPDAKLIALLRDPIERAYSGFLHHQRRGRIAPNAEFLEYVFGVEPERDPLKLIAGGWYWASLEPYVQLFGHNLLVLRHDDVCDRPEEAYRQVLLHVGADSNFEPRDVGAIRHSNRGNDVQKKAVDVATRNQLLHFFANDLEQLATELSVDVRGWRS